jgi:hypothetical protein
VAFSRFANVSCCRFHHLIFTLRLQVAVVPAPSASNARAKKIKPMIVLDERKIGPLSAIEIKPFSDE